MVTQKLTIRLDETELPEIRMVSGDIGREIQIEVYAREDSENPIDLETYSADITLIKPDNTFIMDHFNVDKYELPENAGAVSGSGYYQIKIYTAGTHQIYTGQGRFLVDDMILSDDVIESSSIAFGDRFPEDFATKEWVDDEIEATGIGTYVAGNPAGEETMPPLVRLQINDDIYPISHKIEEMEDADITAPAEGDVLTYDADDQKWKNEPLVIHYPTVTKTATGNPIEITDGADAPLVKCVTAITGYQSGSGTPSPDNIRPITAYTEGEIEVRGKNIVDRTNDVNGYSMSQSGETTVNADMCYSALHRVKTGTTYTFSGISAVMAYRGVIGFDASGNYVVGCGATSSQIAVGNSYSITFTVPNGVSQIRTSSGIADTKVQIEKGQSVTDYEPFKGTTHTTNFPSAIYRGSEDVVNGSVVKSWGVVTYSDATGFVEHSSGRFYHAGLPTGADTTREDAISNCGVFSQTSTNYGGFAFGNSGVYINKAYASEDFTAFNTRLQTTPYVIAYALVTPTTSSVTPTNLPIKSLSGYNHIESSTGDMEVEYITETYDAITAAPKAEYHKLNNSSIAVPADPGIVVTLPESIYSYDELVFTALPDSSYSGTYGTQQAVLTRPLEVGKSYLFNITPGVNMAIYFEVTSATQLTFLRGWQAYEYTITDLTGIKWR